MFSTQIAARPEIISLFSLPIDFILFGLTLLGVAFLHRHGLRVALIGLAAIVFYKTLFTGFTTGTGVTGLIIHLRQEWVVLANLLCLLTGFVVLARHFEKSHVPVVLLRFMPHDWKGAFLLLVVVWVSSSFLDNIAAVLIGGAMARQLFRARVHIGYLAALVAAANAGGAWSVVGDTTTTLMWVDGVSPFQVFEAIIGSSISLFIFGIPAAILQQRHSPILRHSQEHTQVDWPRVVIVVLILAGAVGANVLVNLDFPQAADHFPFIGVAVCLAIVASVRWRQPDWEALPEAVRGAVFLLALVLCASLMPLEDLPRPSWTTALGLGFLSSVFDNIPLTALALKQGGYDWGFLAFSVGFGGSIIWLGSSAGVALSNLYPESRSIWLWLRHGWFVAVAYVIGFFAMLSLWPWNPDPPHKTRKIEGHSSSQNSFHPQGGACYFLRV